ncbi:MAG: phospholipid carrier-dependent glycosyltransferase [Ruminococcaceae bacterium]|nr:phospholipid carrier-dependent glycosyltransferase [Oscillospiraceae bacterium]
MLIKVFTNGEIMLATILFSVIYCAAMVLVYFDMDKKESCGRALNTKSVCLAVGAAAVLRIFLALQDYCFTYDINCFKAWGSYANSLGFKNLYSGEFFLDYPPGYMYILALINGLTNLLGININSIGATFLVKLPAMAADFAIAYLIYRFASKNGLGAHKAAFAGLAFLFMPNVVFNSSVWGQIESWYMLFILLSFCFAYSRKTVLAAISYAVALITKPQAFMFGPILLFYIVRRKSVKELFKAVGTGFAVFYLMALPFCRNPFDVSWLVKLYGSTMSGYKYYTVNAFNLYYLTKLNWVQLKDTVFVQLVTPAVIVISLVVAAFILFGHKKYKGFFAAQAVIVSCIFAFCPMMHERYLWPAAVLCVLAYITSGKKGYLGFGAVFGCLCYINSSWVMAMYYQTFNLSGNAERAVSLAAVAVTAAFVVYTVFCTAKYEITDMKKLKSFVKPNYVLAAVTAVYAFFALFNLGSTKAPQTFFTATDKNYSFTVEFENPVQLGSIYAYSGLGDQFSQNEGQKLLGEFEISFSENGRDFAVNCNIENMSVYTWKETVPDMSAWPKGVKAVRVRAKYVGDVLHEIAFFDTDGNAVTGKITDSDSTNLYPAINAFDEQNTVPADTSYFGGMYFDEIYHGRTAYEQLKGFDIYETTHPPLGKILISIGIAIFGMTPFGWRIVGALCGVIMVPVMYLLVNALCKNRWAACFAASLLAFDFMHLTQTRIATVDTYVVLFVMLTFMFMACWHNTPWGSKKGWLQLALSGVFMGCAVASKWNGAYPMIALAALFFISLFIKYKGSQKTRADKVFAAKTLLLCCVFFVAVPLVIYAASFIPVIKADSFADYLRQFVSYQQHMYSYHANLVAEHYFSSVWYTWPFSIKPIWYAITEKGALASSISAFGNPAVWALTPFAAAYCLFKGIKDKNVAHLFASLGWLASYLPWVMVTRLCFIYHYFPCAVFGIMAIALAAKDLCNAKPKAKKAVGLYLGVCIVLFLMFLPVTTGGWTTKTYLDFLELLPQWHFVNM